MRCPYCGNLDDKVLESRTMINGESIRRRRECLACGYRFTSYERIDEKPFMVVKRDGRRQPFDRAKLEKGIEFKTGSINTLNAKKLVTATEEKEFSCDIVYNNHVVGHCTKKSKIYKLVNKD